MTVEPTDEADRLASGVIGAAIEVHRILGPGYLEKIYEEAMAIEFGLRGISFSRHHPTDVVYKGHTLGEGQIDFLVGGSSGRRAENCRFVRRDPQGAGHLIPEGHGPSPRLAHQLPRACSQGWNQASRILARVEA